MSDYEEDLSNKVEAEIGPWRVVSKKDAARLQILTACTLLFEGNWECAMTLAGAAEGQIPETKNAIVPDIFTRIKSVLGKNYASEREHVSFENSERDWLKHNSDQSNKLIYEFKAFMMVARAASKYWSVYRDNSEDIQALNKWLIEQNYPFNPDTPV